MPGRRLTRTAPVIARLLSILLIVLPASSTLSRAQAPLSDAQERALKPGDELKECRQCPSLVVVPAGTFMMGSPNGERWRDRAEGPQHKVAFARPFAVGRFAVTFEEWDACVTDGGCNGYRPDDNGWGRGRQPAINLSWRDANAYVAWLSRRTGRAYRLLSEAGREYVTRAGTLTPYWWGSSISTRQANYQPVDAKTMGRPMPVDSFQPNPWALYQVHGNVWDIVEDCWNDSYDGAPADGSARVNGDCSRRVIRGGFFGSGVEQLRAAFRAWTDAEFRLINGFRVARTLTEPQSGPSR
jgi:formylglycine-generating enzyme required for sulfatase activity